MAAPPWPLLLLLLAGLPALHHGVSIAHAFDDDVQRNILQLQGPISSQGDEADGLVEEALLPEVALPEAEVLPPSSKTQEGLLGTLLPPSAPSLAEEVSAVELGEPQSSSEAETQEDDHGGSCDRDIPLEKTHMVAEAVMKLGANLLRQVELENGKGNLFFSPLSISLALAHLALGAANQTEQQLLKALHVESVPCPHQALRTVSQHLSQTTLSIAARLYLQKGFPVKEQFLEDSEKFYRAKPATLSGNSEADLAAINTWVKDATHGQISTMLTELPASVVMLLLNAVHFRGFWKNKFDPLLTEPDTFYLDDELTVSVEMMRARVYPLSWFTLDAHDVQVARFPFKGNTSFVAILPNHPEQNFSRLLSDLSQANFQSHFPKERPTMVKMPKLHLQHHLNLEQALRQLGLGELFSAPNFRLITEGPLVVSSVQHRAALELSEAGVEASAATSVSMYRSLSAFNLNQPFLFIIQEDTTGIPLFLGAIRNPNPSAPQERKMSDCAVGNEGKLFPCSVDQEKP
ncbi:alpha-2-antiplasmin [Zootoca vivipara]|uniref:alpha-2-antiplasmin n=1 Tax=Zootoca vivipara TaxID=8524 RepID=UPI0015906223|nr:alpha-2-antiplasmin [Zootoca vivipara]XP_034995205.1 alpha-2-antiplasmin [Zootoca vivipara]